MGQAAGQLISGAPTINQNQNGPGHVESCHLSQDQQNYEGLKVKPALLMKFKQEDCCSFFCQIVWFWEQYLGLLPRTEGWAPDQLAITLRG